MWNSAVFWKDSLSVIDIPFTFQVLFSFQVKSTFTINYSTIIMEHNNHKLHFLLRHRFTASPFLQFLSSPPVGKTRGPTQTSIFQESLPSHRRYRSFWIQCHSERRPCGLLAMSAELLTQKICNTWERPSSSSSPKGRKNSLADRTFNQTSADTGSILSSSINHSLTLTICKYIWRSISYFRSQTLSSWEHLLLLF